MPRAPRVRPPDADAPRRMWLSQLKEDAVLQLPSDASPAIRAQLCLGVESALRHHEPDDPALELQDILSTLVAEACGKLADAKGQARQAARKRQLLAFAKSTLTDVINECPTYLVGAIDSEKRTHLTRAVWADLRAVLEKVLPTA